MKKESYVVLLSSGLDSSVNLLQVLKSGGRVPLVLTFDYGQRAASKEIEHAAKQCAEHGLNHKVITLPWFKEITQTSLVSRSQEIPLQVKIEDLKSSQESAKRVWVPNRNGVFLNIAAAYAESLSADYVVPGFNLEEAQTFPDNSQEYLEAQSFAFKYSTANNVKVRCFTTGLNKTQIVKLGQELGLNFDNVWPCYFGESSRCGKCESCLRFDRAIRNVGL